MKEVAEGDYLMYRGIMRRTPTFGYLRVIVLDDVEGKTVTIATNGLASEFDMFSPEGQNVIGTVERGGL